MKTNFKKNMVAENDFMDLNSRPYMARKTTSLEGLPTISEKNYPFIENLARFTVRQVWGSAEKAIGKINPTDYFQKGFNTIDTLTYSEKIFQIFVLVTYTEKNVRAFLINTEGSNYCRYMAEII